MKLSFTKSVLTNWSDSISDEEQEPENNHSAAQYNDVFDKSKEPQPKNEPDPSVRVEEEEKVNPDGSKVKVFKSFRGHFETVKVNKKVEARKDWKKFGACAGKPPGPERGITSVLGEEVLIEPFHKDTIMLKLKTEAEKLGIKCRICNKTGHFSTFCPISAWKPSQQPLSEREGAYRPPQLRNKSSSYSVAEDRRENDPTIRIANLSEDAVEVDIHELCRPFGKMTKVYLGKDRDGRCKGFAFVTFAYREDADRARLSMAEVTIISSSLLIGPNLP